jgi:hypothetical protein
VAKQWPPIFAASTTIVEVHGRDSQRVHGQSVIVFVSAHCTELAGDKDKTLGSVRIPVRANAMIDDWHCIGDGGELELKISYTASSPEETQAEERIDMVEVSDLSEDSTSPAGRPSLSSPTAVSEATPCLSPRIAADEAESETFAWKVDPDPQTEDTKKPRFSAREGIKFKGEQTTPRAAQRGSPSLRTPSADCFVTQRLRRQSNEEHVVEQLRWQLRESNLQLMVTQEELDVERGKRLRAEREEARLRAELEEAIQSRPQDRMQLQLARSLSDLVQTCLQSRRRDESEETCATLVNTLTGLLTTRDDAARHAARRADLSLSESRQSLEALESLLVKEDGFSDLTDVQCTDRTASFSGREPQFRGNSCTGSKLYESIRPPGQQQVHVENLRAGLDKIEDELKVISRIVQQADRSCAASISALTPKQATNRQVRQGVGHTAEVLDAELRQKIVQELDSALEAELASSKRVQDALRFSTPARVLAHETRSASAQKIDSLQAAASPALSLAAESFGAPEFSPHGHGHSFFGAHARGRSEMRVAISPEVSTSTSSASVRAGALPEGVSPPETDYFQYA